MKVYISGPISGLKQEEYEHKFGLAEAAVLEVEHEPVNPLKVGACVEEDCWERYRDARGLPTPGGGAPVKEDGTTFLHHYACYMKYDILALLECDAILMIPGWSASRGAQIEKGVAEAIGLPVFMFFPGEKVLIA